MENSKLTLSDTLALKRTMLANERTFLAYFRSFIVFLSSGFAIINLNALNEIRTLGFFFLCISPILLGFGIFRYFYTKRTLDKHKS